MRPSLPIGLASALAWFAFPLVPTLLGLSYQAQLNWSFGTRDGPDPRDWGWLKWIILAGPLVGYGFLAGSTLDLPDDPDRRGPRGWLSRRSHWVAVGPWAGFVVWAALFLATAIVNWAYPPSRSWSFPSAPEVWWVRWLSWLGFWGLGVGPLAGGWLILAWAALRRANRIGRLGRSLGKGLGVAVGFVGSLFGSFWAITEVWRTHFFDPRIAPALVAAASLALLSGCSNTVTLGEVRRRELFGSMLVAWLLGLALAWRWWSRSKPRP
jgi:hypothetical protein